MGMDKAPVCFCCALPVEDPPVLNRLADGRPCAVCADRLLESLPPALPAPREAAPASGGELHLLGAPARVDRNRGDLDPTPSSSPSSRDWESGDSPA
jgi:hypothetical protein